MLNKEKIRLGYQYFYQREYGNIEYKFLLTENSSKLIDNFLILLQKNFKHSFHGLGESFLFNFFSYQFEFWNKAERDVKDFSNRIVPSLLFNKKGLQRFLERDKKWDWLFDYSEYLNTKKMFRNEFIKLVKGEPKKEIGLEVDFYRQLDHNTDKGLDNCILYTSLFDRKNIFCLSCNYKTTCKELLRVNNPILYEKRGYGK